MKLPNDDVVPPAGAKRGLWGNTLGGLYGCQPKLLEALRHYCSRALLYMHVYAPVNRRPQSDSASALTLPLWASQLCSSAASPPSAPAAQHTTLPSLVPAHRRPDTGPNSTQLTRDPLLLLLLGPWPSLRAAAAAESWSSMGYGDAPGGNVVPETVGLHCSSKLASSTGPANRDPMPAARCLRGAVALELRGGRRT
jgi:hypothetical protein